MPSMTSHSDRKRAQPLAEPTSCLVCGRDTRHPSGVCARCARGGHSYGTVDEDRAPSLEDRYDEESGPDSICHDQSLIDHALMKIA